MSDIGRVYGGRWRVERPLAAGGMGAVFVAVDVTAPLLAGQAPREVALKIIKQEAKARDAQLVARFKREAAALASVKHENVVAFLDSGVEDGAIYLVMELLTGKSLRALWNATPGHRLDWTRAFLLVADVCAGLAALHAAGIIHRDLKPENVLVTTLGRAVLIDLGIIRLEENADTALLDVTGAFTQTGVVLGTPGFIAPEQLRGERATPASDVYAAGVMLFELLTGRLPYDGANLELLLRAQVLEQAMSARTFAPWLPEHVDALVARMLARDPQHRISTANEARVLLGDAAGSQAATETAVAPPSRVMSAAPIPPPSTSTLSTREITSALAATQAGEPQGLSLGTHQAATDTVVIARELAPARSNRSTVVASAILALITAGLVSVAVAIGFSSPDARVTTSSLDAGTGTGTEPRVVDAGSAPQVATTGTLDVDATPKADIYVDDRPFGPTPRTIELAPGPHVVKLVGAGGIVRERNVEIVAGATVDVVETMSDPGAIRRVVMQRLRTLPERAGDLKACGKPKLVDEITLVAEPRTGKVTVTTSNMNPRRACVIVQSARWRVDPFEGERVTVKVNAVIGQD